MATGFGADVQALRSPARDLEQALHSMAAARGELSAASHGQTGEGSLDRACGEFQGKWGYGLPQLEKTAGAFVEGLNQTVKAYQTAEDEIQKSFGGGGGHGVLTPIDHGPRLEPGPVHRLVIDPGPIEQPSAAHRPVIEPVGYIAPPRIQFGPTLEQTDPQSEGTSQ